ncbi:MULTISPECIES: tetratricopeptide repeat protein [unclassified Flavobacterium]|uniref:tetratricopeptide repeat protein n=1 Tax=unclassified Flavobacterium TaxID=196869 RepID=UPI00360C9937
MKNLVYLFLLLTQSFWAQEAFDAANSLYQQSKYVEAASTYEGILQTQKESAELYFNLGNCYYKLKKVAPAIYNYEKALMLNPGDAEIENNLRFAQGMTIDEITETPKVGFAKIILDFTSGLHFDTWAWIAVIMSFFVFLTFAGYYLASETKTKRIFFFAMLFSFFMVAISLISGFSEKHKLDNERPAIVFEKEVIVKSEPNAAAQKAFILHEGTKVYILENIGNYRKIQLSDQKEGWIAKSAIKELK